MPTTTWIDDYIEWACRRSPLTPCHFHEGIAYTLVACAVAGRVFVQTAQEKVYPNLYTLIIGKTSVFAKTVAMNLALDLAERAHVCDRIINSVFTPEAVVNELGGIKPSNWGQLPPDTQKHWTDGQAWAARRTFVIDEAGRFFNSLERDYNATLADLWMSLYDCKETIERTSIKHGYIVIQNPVPSCLFATTPSSIRRTLRNPDMWTQGFWTRWNFHVGDAYTPFVKAKYEDAPISLVRQLIELDKNLGTLKKPYQAVTDNAVRNAYEEMLEKNRSQIFAGDNEYLESFLARLHTKRLKASLLLATLESCGIQPHVTMRHWDATQVYAERMQADVEKLSEIVRQTEVGTLQDKILAVIQSQNGSATSRDLQQRLKIHAGALKEAIDPLVRLGQIEALPTKNSQGRKGLVFHLVSQ